LVGAVADSLFLLGAVTFYKLQIDAYLSGGGEVRSFSDLDQTHFIPPVVKSQIGHICLHQHQAPPGRLLPIFRVPRIRDFAWIEPLALIGDIDDGSIITNCPTNVYALVRITSIPVPIGVADRLFQSQSQCKLILAAKPTTGRLVKYRLDHLLPRCR